jgi:hypothetical protein
MNLDPLDARDSFFIIAAFRYALGRRTYATSIVGEKLIEAAPELGPSDKALIVHEIDKAIERNCAGDPCDVEEWQRVKAALEAT